MSDINSTYNRVVWIDIPVADLDRAANFYRAVLNCEIDRQEFDGSSFCVLSHLGGNAGCLVLEEKEIASNSGILVYLNVDRRIREAVTQVENFGGKVIQRIHMIGQHGFRAIVLDSEGNRLALHSSVDS